MTTVKNELEIKHTPTPWAVDSYAMYIHADNQQMKICDIRGWGYLTGRKNLSDEDAIAIQAANAKLIVDSVNNSTAQAERIKELEALISDIYKDLKFRAGFTEQPKVLDISNGILNQMKEIIEESK